MLRDYGNIGYDAIKVVEPMCVHRWLTIAGRSEYDVQSANKFLKHLNETKGKLGDWSYEFFDLIITTLKDITDSFNVGTIFGSFRLWGHPFIDYKEGLKALKKQCRMKKLIDIDYAHTLADDPAYLVIKDHYLKTGQWAVSPNSLPKELVSYVKEGRWPSEKFLNGLNIKWSLLPKLSIFSVPADIPISQLYSDKSFSMTREELSEHLSKPKKNTIPSKRVLEELLKRPAIDPRDLAEEINANGLYPNDLIIGLKEK